ncbi:hypothetical protein FFE93_013790 [Yersinia sp. KBS0713]|nr:hypothetical protein FFE93_013790 [Yersinia sp. KBS0713]
MDGSTASLRSTCSHRSSTLSVIRVTNLSGADLNAAGSGLAEARPMDGPSNERSQHTCSLKDDNYPQ